MPRERLQAQGSHLQACAVYRSLSALARDGQSGTGHVFAENLSAGERGRDRAQAGGAAERDNPMTAHTPLPWKRGGVFRAGTGWAEYIIGPCTSHDPTRIVCGLEDARMGKEMMEATAEFIVRACNGHADLVAALAGLLDIIELWNWDCSDENRTDEVVVARTALARVKGD